MWISLDRPDGRAGGLRALLTRAQGRLAITNLCLYGEEIDADTITSISITRIHAAANQVPRAHRPAPANFRDRSELYPWVAEAYWFYASTVGRGVAVAIAADVGVPASTVHGWIRDARRHGFLPPGRKGRTG